jgi:hypothetical protein
MVMSMVIDDDLAAFLESPVLIILGTSDDTMRPQIGRGVGAMVAVSESRVDLILSHRQWPVTVANVRANGRLAATFARPRDYVSYQVKGRATVGEAAPAHLARSHQYIAATSGALVTLGVAPWVAERWFTDQELLVFSLAMETIYVQTPGQYAGRSLQP